MYGSNRSRSKNSSIIFADLRGEIRPATITFFDKVLLTVDGIHLQTMFVALNWFKNHPQEYECGKPVTISEHDLFYECNYLPVNKILRRTVTLVDKLNDTTGNAPYE